MGSHLSCLVSAGLPFNRVGDYHLRNSQPRLHTTVLAYRCDAEPYPARCVCALDTGLSTATNEARKLNCFAASVGALLTTGTFSVVPIACAISRKGMPSSATAWYAAGPSSAGHTSRPRVENAGDRPAPNAHAEETHCNDIACLPSAPQGSHVVGSIFTVNCSPFTITEASLLHEGTRIRNANSAGLSSVKCKAVWSDSGNVVSCRRRTV